MGVNFSFPRFFLRLFRRRDNLQLLQNASGTPDGPHPQSAAFLSHTNLTETIEATCSGDKLPLSHSSNDDSQIAAPANSSAQVATGCSWSPCPTNDTGLPFTLPHSAALFALIIGIDDYVGCGRLRGAVADAKAMKDYLREVLWISEDHIHTLFDSRATRSAIIEAFKILRNDERIQCGDPILIFYAGHGGELDAPPAWGLDNNKIQCLLPRDYKANVVEPIPDRTIGSLIEDIAKAKGDNISVIFDCCYSASGTRPDNSGYMPRTVNLDINIPAKLDSGIWGGRTGATSNWLVHHGLRSHVLLAACGEKELAYEHEGRGQFTNALLSTLKNHAINNLTYAQIIECIRLPMQHPQCEGLNQHRILFNGRVSAGKQARREVRVEDNDYVIAAGFAHGVSQGVEFTLYSDLNPALGVVMVDGTAAIEDFQTTVPINETHLRNAAFARLTRLGTMPLYFSQGGTSPILQQTFQKMVGNGTSDVNFRLVREANEAKMEVAMENNRVAFKVLDQRVKRFGLTKLPHTATTDTIAHILGAATHYYWYLDLTNKTVPIVQKQDIVVDFYRLEVDYDDWGLPLYTPAMPGFCQEDPVDKLDVIDFTVDPSAVYGIEIKNNTQRDLYLNAFLFNDSSFSIAPYYTQTSAGEPEPPLKRNGTFTIGYGSTGTPPFAYWLDEGQDVDVGHLKIFFATRAVDMTDVVQPSPFTSARHRGDDDVRGARLSLSPAGTQPPCEPQVDTWFTIKIPIVQRRRERSIRAAL